MTTCYTNLFLLLWPSSYATFRMISPRLLARYHGFVHQRRVREYPVLLWILRQRRCCSLWIFVIVFSGLYRRIREMGNVQREEGGEWKACVYCGWWGRNSSSFWGRSNNINPHGCRNTCNVAMESLVYRTCTPLSLHALASKWRRRSYEKVRFL